MKGQQIPFMIGKDFNRSDESVSKSSLLRSRYVKLMESI